MYILICTIWCGSNPYLIKYRLKREGYSDMNLDIERGVGLPIGVEEGSKVVLYVF